MDPKDIARLITEDERFVQCPTCANEYATVAGEDIACPREGCPRYDKEYAETLEAIEGATVKITDFYYDIIELDWGDVKKLIDRGKTGENYRAIAIPYHINARGTDYYFGDGPEEDEDVEALVWWKGSNAVSHATLRRKFEEWVQTWR